MADPLARQLNEAMQQAVQQVVGGVYPGDLVTRFVVVAETIDGDTGKQTVVTAATPNLAAWDSLGLLTWALQMEQALAVSDRLED